MTLIDKDALLEKLSTFHPDYTFNITSFRNFIKAQPEVEKKGKWINCVSSEHWKCSCCGVRASYWFSEENSSEWDKDMSEWLSDYCPNCGARMEKEK